MQIEARAAAARSTQPTGSLRYALRECLQRIPLRPMLLDACAAALARPTQASPRVADDALNLRAFLKLRQALLDGAPRSRDLQLLWRNAVATAHYAARLAEALAMDVRQVALGALLHEAGEMRVQAALTRAETSSGAKFEQWLRGELRAEHAPGVLQRLLAAWSIGANSREIASNWRGAANEARPCSGAAVVRAAHALAAGHGAPPEGMPGLDQAARAELALDRELIDSAARDDACLAQLLERVT